MLTGALSAAIAQQQLNGRIARDLAPDQIAHLVLAMVDGLSLRAFIDRRLGKRGLDALLQQALSRLLEPR
jgi:BetI-type transcriptional repressor, C-terminal